MHCTKVEGDIRITLDPIHTLPISENLSEIGQAVETFMRELEEAEILKAYWSVAFPGK